MAGIPAIGRPRDRRTPTLALCAGLALVAGSGAAAAQVAPAASARALDDGALRSVYLDLCGRPPLADERAQWLGKELGELTHALVVEREAWSRWYEEQLYYFLLVDNFRPQTPRVDAIPDELAAGTLEVRDAIHRIALCPSFDQRNPGADTFVTVVMEQLLGLVVQKNPRELEIGKKLYDGASGTFLGTAGRSQADVVRIAIEHRLFAECFLRREYGRLTGREPDAKELAGWTKSFQADPAAYRALLAGWLDSPAYAKRLGQRRPMPNRLFVRALGVDLLGRVPSDDESFRLRTALDGLSDPTPLRAVLARLMLDSGKVKLPARDAIPDAPAWIRETFLRLLGRAPDASELELFTDAFADPACKPSTVVLAIVSHPDYATY